jgi:hypothetical protein
MPSADRARLVGALSAVLNGQHGADLVDGLDKIDTVIVPPASQP